MNFNYYLPAKINFGRGRVNELADKIKLYGKKPLLVTDGKGLRSTGIIERIEKLIIDGGLQCAKFDEVTPNPTNELVKRATVIAKENGCDVIVGLGGGSMMDTAKAVAFCSINDGDLFEDYIYKKAVIGKQALPIILIPTTCGTGSEANGVSVITNEKNNDKSGMASAALFAKESIVDPELLQSLPKKVFASVAFDALCHNMEAYLSKNSTPMTDVFAQFGIKLLGENLIKAYNDLSDKEALDNVSLASTIGGMILFNASGTALHGMEHPASGLRNVTHGEGLAALAPYVFRENAKHAKEKCAFISRALGGKDETDCALMIEELLKKINLRIKLSDLGVQQQDIEWMAKSCLGKRAMNCNPVEFTYDDIVAMYNEAL